MRNDMNKILDKYFKGESHLEEEKLLREYFSSNEFDEELQDLAPVFNYFNSEAKLGKSFEPNLSFIKEKKKVSFLFPKIIGIAASLLLLFGLTQIFVNQDTMYKNKYTEIEDPKEGLEFTLETLGFASTKMNNAIKPVLHIKELETALQPISHIKELEKAAVFNFNK